MFVGNLEGDAFDEETESVTFDVVARDNETQKKDFPMPISNWQGHLR